MEEQLVTKTYLDETLKNAFFEFGEQMKIWFENLLDEKLEEKLESKLEEKLDSKLEQKFEEKLTPIWNEMRLMRGEMHGLRMDMDVTRMDLRDLRAEMKDGFTNTNKRVDLSYNHIDHFILTQKELTKRINHIQQKQPA